MSSVTPAYTFLVMVLAPDAVTGIAQASASGNPTVHSMAHLAAWTWREQPSWKVPIANPVAILDQNVGRSACASNGAARASV